MKRLGMVLVMLLPAAAAFAQHGIFIGGAGTYYMHPGSGEIENNDFTFTDDYYSDEPGLALESKTFYGIVPTVGYRFSDLLAVAGSYAYYMKKTGSDNTNIQGTELDFDSELSQHSIRIMLYLYPFKNGDMEKLYFTGGLDMVSFSVDIKGALLASDGYYYLDQHEDDTGKANGLIFGAGYDYRVGEALYIYGAGTYSLAKYKDDLFSGGYKADAEIKVGGIALEGGFKYFFNK